MQENDSENDQVKTPEIERALDKRVLFATLNIDQRLIETLAHHGLTTATLVQQQTIPYAMAGNDLLVASKTGSGKTFAFLLPMLHQLLHKKALVRGQVRAVILAPTRELAKQVYQQLRLLTASTVYQSQLIVGGENFNDQYKMLRNGVSIIVATPGRLADHLEQNNVSLHGVEQLIIDEGDRILDLGFAEALRQIDKKADHRKRQTLFFSATLDHEQVKAIVATMLKQPRNILIDRAQTMHQQINQQFIFADGIDHKQKLLSYVLSNISFKQLILFCATKVDCEMLTALIMAHQDVKTKGFTAIALHGDMTQNQRTLVMQRFKSAQNNILVATDVASRGLDLNLVSHVINFDLPKHAQEYVHRIGRTGRAGQQGDAYSFVGPKDWQSLLAIKAFLDYSLQFTTFPNLVAKFKGAPKPNLMKKNVRIDDKTVSNKKSVSKKIARKRDKSYYEREDVGGVVFRIKKKIEEVYEDDD